MAKKNESSSKPAAPAAAAPNSAAPAPAKRTVKAAPAKPKPAAKKATPAKVTPAKAAPAKATKAPAAPKAKRAPKAAASVVPTYTHDDVALRAYFISEKRRSQGLGGDEHQDWLEAERQLLAESLASKKAKKA